MKMASLLTLILLLFSVNMVAFAVDSPDEVFYAHAKGIACHRPAELAKVLSEADPIAYINDWARLRCAGYCRGCAYVDRIALIVPSEINGVTDYRPHPYPGADFPIYNIKVAVDMTGGMGRSRRLVSLYISKEGVSGTHFEPYKGQVDLQFKLLGTDPFLQGRG